MAHQVEIHDEQITQSFQRMMRFVRNPRSALADVGRYGVSSTRLRFRTQTDPDGRRWFPSRRAKEQGGQTLRDTSRLNNSITYNADNTGVEWGTNVRYGAAHQFWVYRAVRIGAHQRRNSKVQKYQVLTTSKAGKKRLSTRTEKINSTRTWVRAHSRIMRVPRRAFLGVNSNDRLAILQISSKYLRASVTGQS